MEFLRKANAAIANSNNLNSNSNSKLQLVAIEASQTYSDKEKNDNSDCFVQSTLRLLQFSQSGKQKSEAYQDLQNKLRREPDDQSQLVQRTIALLPSLAQVIKVDLAWCLTDAADADSDALLA